MASEFKHELTFGPHRHARFVPCGPVKRNGSNFWALRTNPLHELRKQIGRHRIVALAEPSEPSADRGKRKKMGQRIMPACAHQVERALNFHVDSAANIREILFRNASCRFEPCSVQNASDGRAFQADRFQSSRDCFALRNIAAVISRVR